MTLRIVYHKTTKSQEIWRKRNLVKKTEDISNETNRGGTPSMISNEMSSKSSISQNSEKSRDLEKTQSCEKNKAIHYTQRKAGAKRSE